MSKTAEISVVISTYNRSRVMLETLDSVLQQTYRDFEVVVVSDGSTDDTAAVLKPYVERGQIRFREQENQGPAATRNTGLAEATGKYICFLDDDDLWSPDKLAWQVEAWKRAPDDCVLVYGYCIWFGEGLEPTPAPETIQPSGKVFKEFCYKNRIASAGQTMIRTDIAREIGGFDTTLFGPEDWDFWLRLATQGTFHYEHKLALKYRLQAKSVSRNIQRMHENRVRVVQKQENSPAAVADPEARTFLQRHRDIATTQNNVRITNLTYVRTLQYAVRYKESGQTGKALQILLQGIKEAPWMLRMPEIVRLLMATLLPQQIKRLLKADK
ncbi:MAG: hypothetical protein OHK0029_21720 [Armatimonadaceae bacterium]